MNLLRIRYRLQRINIKKCTTFKSSIRFCPPLSLYTRFSKSIHILLAFSMRRSLCGRISIPVIFTYFFGKVKRVVHFFYTIQTMRNHQINNEANSAEGGGAGENAANRFIRLQQSQTVRNNIQQISQMLNTGLSPEALDICIKLCEAGVHPEALAEVVSQIRRELAALNQDD